jgi:hypothetical protein
MAGKGLKSHDAAVEEFDRRGNRTDGSEVVASLNVGLPNLRDLVYERLHADVERAVGVDSMLIPVSEMKTQKEAKTAIELFQIAESVSTVRNTGYVGSENDWYANWLAMIRLGDRSLEQRNARQMADYLSMDENGRRLALTDVLSAVLPQSRQTPLVLFRLLPLAVQIVTAFAFNDPDKATEVRTQQKTLLPSISDCQACHGQILKNGKTCEVCGNPIWNFEWLTVAG